MKIDSIFTKSLPFMVLLLGGALGLTQVQKARYSESERKKIKEEDLDKYMSQNMREIMANQSLQNFLKADEGLEKKGWENIRGPPENIADNRRYQAEQKRRMRELQEEKLKS